MKKNLILLVVLFSFALLLFGCTAQERAKNWGGTAEVDLPQGKKLVLVTWKDSDLWYLTRDMKPNEVAETYTFSESSSWGAMEGTIIIREHR